MTSPAPARMRGLACVAAANFCFSTGGWFVRSFDSAPDGFEVVFWRTLTMIATLAVWLAWRYGRTAPAQIVAVGGWGVVSAAFLALTFFGYLVAVSYTSVANVTVTMAVAPFVTAIAGLVFLGERVPGRTWAAIALAAVGMAVMLAGAFTGAGLIGIAIALGVPLGLAGNVVVNRRHGKTTDMVPTVLVAGLIALPIAFAFGRPLSASAHDIALLSLMGVVQVGAGCLLLTIATRTLQAAEIGLWTLLETALGPIWAWLAAGERPSGAAILGGALIASAVIANAGLGHARARAGIAD